MKLDYDSCCNNFRWCTQNVAKGIWRDELSYAMFMLHSVVKSELHFMTSWDIGIHDHFIVPSWKPGKAAAISCIPRAALTVSMNMYETPCSMLVVYLDKWLRVGFSYNIEGDENMTGYLKKFRRLPHP